MGNIPSGKPSPRQDEWLNDYHLFSCKEAAEAIKKADIFLVHVGAGFSADSGLAVYKDIADIPAYHNLNLEYYDLCKTHWIADNPGIFYGFWGKCFNDYRNTEPHKGYKILQNWKKKYFLKSKIKEANFFPNEFSRIFNLRVEYKNKELRGSNSTNVIPNDLALDPFFIFSSNVDGHFQKAGFLEGEIFEIHGSTEHWQCSKPSECNSIENNNDYDLDLPTAYNGNSFSSKEDFMQDLQDSLQIPDNDDINNKFWKAPPDFQFIVNENTMEAIDKKYLDCSSIGFESNFPRCIQCKRLARPNVLMFEDSEWLDDEYKSSIFELWRDIAISYCETGKKLVILEIGCGINVPTVRMSSERKLILISLLYEVLNYFFL